jgi:two-component system chemotaxis response regulator CheY
MKVLIVDDNEEVRRMISTFIADLVDEVIECADGIDVLSAYSSHRPDFVLMDLKMKLVDGLTATKQIKREFPEARIVMVSQCEEQRLRAAAALAGAEAYVGKADLDPLRKILAGV